MKSTGLKIIITITAFVVGTLGLAATASAAESARSGASIAKQVFASSSPKATYAKLSKAEQQRFREATTARKGVQQSKRVLNLGGGCWGLHATWKRTAVAGNTLYTYWQTTTVCTKKGKITKVKVTDAGGETSTPGWRIAKKPSVSTKNVGWEGRGKAQYHFVLGAGGWDIAHPTDCLQLRLNKKQGLYSSSSSCNLAGG